MAKTPKPIQIKPSRNGLLHAKLGVPQGQPIPASKLAAAKASPSPALRKEATFAQNAKGFAHPTGPAKTPRMPRRPLSPLDPGDGDVLPTMHTSKHH